MMEAITLGRLDENKPTSKCFLAFLAPHILIQIVKYIDYSIAEK